MALGAGTSESTLDSSLEMTRTALREVRALQLSSETASRMDNNASLRRLIIGFTIGVLVHLLSRSGGVTS